jgi:hypothetical protein
LSRGKLLNRVTIFHAPLAELGGREFGFFFGRPLFFVGERAMIVNSFGLLGRFIVEFRFFFFQTLLAVAGIDVGIGGIMLNFMFGRGDGIFQVVVF